MPGRCPGAKWVGVTVIGLGERAGNAAMEEVVMAPKHLKGLIQFQNRDIQRACRICFSAAKRELPAWKPIVGSNMFAMSLGSMLMEPK